MSTQYWEEEIEIMESREVAGTATSATQKTINIAANSPYYKEVFSKTASPEIVSSHWTTSAKFLSPLNRTCVPTIPSG